MKSITISILVASAIQGGGLAAPTVSEELLTKRLDNGLGKTPALGYNNWVYYVRSLDASNLAANLDLRTMEAAHTLLPTRQ